MEEMTMPVCPKCGHDFQVRTPSTRGTYGCEATTKQGKPCPLNLVRLDEASGKNLCHIHHPGGTFRRQIATAKAEREYRGPKLASLNVKKPRAPWPPVETAALKDRC